MTPKQAQLIPDSLIAALGEALEPAVEDARESTPRGSSEMG
jgi:hypothetical protein